MDCLLLISEAIDRWLQAKRTEEANDKFFSFSNLQSIQNLTNGLANK